MVEPDYDPDADPPFTPLPVYTALSEYINHLTPTLYTGVHQAENNWAITTGENAALVTDENAQFSQTVQTNALDFVADGTDIFLRWQGDTISISVDNGTSISVSANAAGWQSTRIASSLLPQAKHITISSETPFVVDSITVTDRIYQHLFGIALVAFIAIVGLILSLVIGLMERRR
jgi:hypothetical protein